MVRIFHCVESTHCTLSSFFPHTPWMFYPGRCLYLFFSPCILLDLSTSCHLILTKLSSYSEIFSCFSMQFSTSYLYARSTKSSTVISTHVDFSLLKTSGVIFNCFTYVSFYLFFLLLPSCKTPNLCIICVPLNTELGPHHRSWKWFSYWWARGPV